MLVILAEFTTRAATHAEFLEHCRDDAGHSVADEPGCHAFDVLLDPEAPDSVVLHEVYEDDAAFEAHRQTPHYARFAAGVERLGITLARVRRLAPA